MGLMDILNGMQNGPRGQKQPSSSGSGGMSPMTMALLGLLAYKAMKSFGGSQATPGGVQPSSVPGTTGAGGGLGDILGGLLGGKAAPSGAGASSGGLGDLLRGGLGGVLGGAAAGSVVSGGLGNLLKDLQANGLGQTAQSWVGTGPNEEVAPGDLESAVGADTLDQLAQHTGMNRNDLLAGLSQQLPGLIDQLTPHGRLPTEDEAQRMV